CPLAITARIAAPVPLPRLRYRSPDDDAFAADRPRPTALALAPDHSRRHYRAAAVVLRRAGRLPHRVSGAGVAQHRRLAGISAGEPRPRQLFEPDRVQPDPDQHRLRRLHRDGDGGGARLPDRLDADPHPAARPRPARTADAIALLPDAAGRGARLGDPGGPEERLPEPAMAP